MPITYDQLLSLSDGINKQIDISSLPTNDGLRQLISTIERFQVNFISKYLKLNQDDQALLTPALINYILSAESFDQVWWQIYATLIQQGQLLLGLRQLPALVLDQQKFRRLRNRSNEMFGCDHNHLNYSQMRITDINAAVSVSSSPTIFVQVHIASPLSITTAAQVALLPLRKDCFKIDSPEAMSEAIRSYPNFDFLYNPNINIGAFDFAGVTFTEINHVEKFLKLRGTLTGVVVPGGTAELDFQEFALSKENIQYLMDLKVSLTRLPLMSLRFLEGLKIRHLEQFPEIWQLQLNIENFIITPMRIKFHHHFRLFSKYRRYISKFSFSDNAQFSPDYIEYFETSELTAAQYARFVLTVFEAQSRVRYALPEELQTDKCTCDYNNSECIQLREWLFELTTAQQITGKLKARVLADMTNIDNAVQQGITKSLLVSLQKEFKSQTSSITLFGLLKPKVVTELEGFITRLTTEQLTRLQVFDLFNIIKAYKLQRDTKQTNANNTSFQTNQALDRFLIILIWLLERSGYKTSDIRPECFSNIGPQYKQFKEIDYCNFLFLTVNGASVVYDIADIVNHFKRTDKLADPSNNRYFSDAEITAIFIAAPRIKEAVVDTGMQAYKALEAKVPKLLSDDFFAKIVLLGEQLKANCNDNYNENLANEQIIGFHNYCKRHPEEKTIGDSLYFKLEVRYFVPTNLSQLFTKMQYDGCTDYLGKSIREWVAKYNEYKISVISSRRQVIITPFDHYGRLAQAIGAHATTNLAHTLRQFNIPSDELGDSNSFTQRLNTRIQPMPATATLATNSSTSTSTNSRLS